MFLDAKKDVGQAHLMQALLHEIRWWQMKGWEKAKQGNQWGWIKRPNRETHSSFLLVGTGQLPTNIHGRETVCGGQQGQREGFCGSVWPVFISRGRSGFAEKVGALEGGGLPSPATSPGNSAGTCAVGQDGGLLLVAAPERSHKGQTLVAGRAEQPCWRL